MNVAYVHAYLKVNEMLNNTSYGKCTLELTPNKFSLTVNKSKTDYKYKNIRRIIVKKNCFKVKFKNRREYLTFEKSLYIFLLFIVFSYIDSYYNNLSFNLQAYLN